MKLFYKTGLKFFMSYPGFPISLESFFAFLPRRVSVAKADKATDTELDF